MITEPAMLREQGPPDRGHIEAVKGQRVPPWPVVRAQGPGLAPETTNQDGTPA